MTDNPRLMTTDKMIRNYDESRLPEREEDGRVSPRNCRIVQATLMLPTGTTAADVQALMERIYGHEPTVLHWSTNWLNAR